MDELIDGFSLGKCHVLSWVLHWVNTPWQSFARMAYWSKSFYWLRMTSGLLWPSFSFPISWCHLDHCVFGFGSRVKHSTSVTTHSGLRSALMPHFCSFRSISGFILPSWVCLDWLGCFAGALLGNLLHLAPCWTGYYSRTVNLRVTSLWGTSGCKLGFPLCAFSVAGSSTWVPSWSSTVLRKGQPCYA